MRSTARKSIGGAVGLVSFMLKVGELSEVCILCERLQTCMNQ